MATILYIEDNSDNLLLVRRAMEAIGYQFIGAETGLDGLRIANEQTPDLILLDINLPDIDGCEVARRLRIAKDHPLFYVPVIAITAKAMKGDATKALEAGCDVYMTKPINIRELWARVESFLALSRRDGEIP
jgi:two-component system cell cycle response regulator DivK